MWAMMQKLRVRVWGMAARAAHYGGHSRTGQRLPPTPLRLGSFENEPRVEIGESFADDVAETRAGAPPACWIVGAFFDRDDANPGPESPLIEQPAPARMRAETH